MVLRIIVSIAALCAYAAFNVLYWPPATIAAGRLAGQQFNNSDIDAVSAQYGLSAIHGVGLIATLLLVGVLILTWFGPVRRWLAALATAAVALAMLYSHPASAYYDKTDYTEAYTIYPNETAFWIPDAGGNKDSQGKMDSADYYNANRVALKRFLIPHAQLSGSGWGPWGNYYVPAGRLIIVDRSPYNREWTAASHRGTANTDQSFPCQDKAGLDVTVEITIGTSVSEENAAKFLYWFGVKPPTGDRRTPEVTFTSVYYGRSLNEVMDTVGRGKVQEVVCSEVSARSLDKVNEDAPAMLAAINTKSREFLGARGITLDYLGWAGTFTFAPGVQAAIDRQYVATKDTEIAKMLASQTVTLQALATAEATRTLAGKWNGQVPASVTLLGIPSILGELLSKVTADPVSK